tara:strand:- start:1231 stop:1488 length:258 start_codon:yes stop_codon:yes gene_type:complete
MSYITEQFKKGYKTTEFWLTIVGGAVVLLNGTFGWGLDAASITGMAGSIAAYIVGRSYLKGQRVNAVSYAGLPEDETTNDAPPVG